MIGKKVKQEFVHKHKLYTLFELVNDGSWHPSPVGFTAPVPFVDE